MNILVVYSKTFHANFRNTINEHLNSFGQYSGEKCYYLNVAAGVPSWISKLSFDLTIYHYTVFACKWTPSSFQALQEKWGHLKHVGGYKVALPQDEYVNSEFVCSFFREFGVKTVFTCLPESEWQKVYPTEKSGVSDFVTVLTGYVDEKAAAKIRGLLPSRRDIDIGYRARKVPFWLGSHGCIKWRLTEVVLDAVRGRGLRIDVSNDSGDVFCGDEWYRFLLRCRVVLGCEGGASLHDPRGEIRQKVDKYVATYPDAPYEEVEKACFPGLDGNLRLFAISPRHFECCITKTCQALVEGEYAGIFKPDVHYIEIKKNWSNINDVIEKMMDNHLCESISENAYKDIVESGKYTYKKFVASIINHCRGFICSSEYAHDKNKIYYIIIVLREKFINIYHAKIYLNSILFHRLPLILKMFRAAKNICF